MEKENSKFKPIKLRLKIDLVSHPARAEKYIYRYRGAEAKYGITFKTFF